MPAVSDAQRKFMGMVLAARRKQLKNPSPEIQQAADAMTDRQISDFASQPAPPAAVPTDLAAKRKKRQGIIQTLSVRG